MLLRQYVPATEPYLPEIGNMGWGQQFTYPGSVIFMISLAGLLLAVVMLLMRRVNTARLKHYLRCLFDFRYDREAGRNAMPPPDTEACRVPFGVAIAIGLWSYLLMQLINTI